MNIENKVAADDLRSHKKLAADVQVMAEQVAHYAIIYEALIGLTNMCRAAEGVIYDSPAMTKARILADVVLDGAPKP
jgi:hypothetical protein